MRRNLKTAVAILAMALALTGCKDMGSTNPCDAQPNPDKQAICQGEY